MRKFQRLAREAGWKPGQGVRGAKKRTVDALSHHYCLSDKTIYELLRSLEISASCQIPDIQNSGETVHPSILIQASRAKNPAKVVKKAVQEGWTVRQVREEVHRQRKVKTPPIPRNKYRCLVVDPPWVKAKIEREVRPRQTGFDYPGMEKEELAALPVEELAYEDAHLYLWTTHKDLPTALWLAEQWDFRHECLLTWVKSVGFTPFSWMYSTEHVLFCRRGNLELLAKGRRLDFSAKVREHSRKPEKFYQLVREVSPGPRIDLFSREAHDGFDQWGNETDKFVALSEAECLLRPVG